MRTAILLAAGAILMVPFLPAAAADDWDVRIHVGDRYPHPGTWNHCDPWSGPSYGYPYGYGHSYYAPSYGYYYGSSGYGYSYGSSGYSYGYYHPRANYYYSPGYGSYYHHHRDRYHR